MPQGEASDVGGELWLRRAESEEKRAGQVQTLLRMLIQTQLPPQEKGSYEAKKEN